MLEVLEQLLKGPEANGYANGLWTLRRVAEVTDKTTGVSYSQSQTWEILRSASTGPDSALPAVPSNGTTEPSSTGSRRTGPA
jgi:hypothetical protein